MTEGKFPAGMKLAGIGAIFMLLGSICGGLLLLFLLYLLYIALS
jgi:hypothetical protein